MSTESVNLAKSPETSTLEEILGQYQRSLRGELLRTSVPFSAGVWWAGANQMCFLSNSSVLLQPGRKGRRWMLLCAWKKNEIVVCLYGYAVLFLLIPSYLN